MSREYHQTVYTPPEGAADLLLIRHGRTEAARPGESFPMLDGHGDPALHPEGEEQAVLVGERLKNDPISAIYVTTLRRTHQTAAPLAAHLGLTPKVEADLRRRRARVQARHRAAGMGRDPQCRDHGGTACAGPRRSAAYCGGASGRAGGGRRAWRRRGCRHGTCERRAGVPLQRGRQWLDLPAGDPGRDHVGQGIQRLRASAVRAVVSPS